MGEKEQGDKDLDRKNQEKIPKRERVERGGVGGGQHGCLLWV